MSRLDVSRAKALGSAAELDCWLDEHGADESELIVALYKKSSGKQTVTFDELLETALCHGWVDTQTKAIDDARLRDPLRAASSRLELVGEKPGARAAPDRGGSHEARRRGGSSARSLTADCASADHEPPAGMGSPSAPASCDRELIPSLR